MPVPVAESPVPSGAGLSLVLSPSSLTKFTECEQQYVYDRALPHGEDGHRVSKWAKGDGLTLGTAVHTLLRERWHGRDWRAAADVAAKEMSPGWSKEWNYPPLVQKAVRLVSRHEEAYPVLPRLIASEWQFKIRHPQDKHLEITGYQDGLTLVSVPDDPEHEGLWVLENKTMGNWQRLDWLDYDPQPVTYQWAARAQGFDVRGVLFDAIYTREWVEERDAVASFKRLWLPYDQVRVDAVLRDYANAAHRIRNLTFPVRNAGRDCVYCDHRIECHGLVAG